LPYLPGEVLQVWLGMLDITDLARPVGSSSLRMSPARILVVEDEAIIRRDIRQQLEVLGYQVVGEASSGSESLTLTHQLQPDLVLMDIGLGAGMDGITAAQTIRDEHALPVVFLSAFAADDVLDRARLAEPYGYILKPFTERELHTVLQMALYKHQMDLHEKDQALRNRVILDNLVSGVLTIDPQGLVVSCNRGACEIFGYTAEEIVRHNLSMLIPEHHRDKHAQYLQQDASEVVNRVICHKREVEGLRKDGRTFPLQITVSRIMVAMQATYIVIVSDISLRRQAEETIQNLAFYDELTGLPNRRRLLDRLQQAIVSATRSGQRGALILLDLDHFRHINDTLGPSFGDELLRQVGGRLQTCVREEDTVAHLGGDEFMVMLETLGLGGQPAALHAESVAQKILHTLNQPYELRGRLYDSSASLGIVMFDKNAGGFDELVKMADAAMYQAKAAGRKTVRFFDPDMQALAVARMSLEKDIQRGLEQQEFVLHYQLQVDARGNPLGVEALVRWQHPVRGLVMPDEFIAVAEDTGLILPLGHWVLDAACQQLKHWTERPSTARWTMAVNVSALQFSQEDFVLTVARAVARSGIDAHRLKLELTESMLIDDLPQVIAKMRSLQAMGVSFSLDDFGTGYSSLTHLKRLPMNQLKIDQSFVRDLMADPDDAVISQTIVALGHNLGMQVIAEGVETVGQRDFLAGIGCDAFQGYLYGRPMPPDALVLYETYIEK
jgi:diguanylate cyclase (GGDEF)-like protein/PAS domain S-box-containing protein